MDWKIGIMIIGKKLVKNLLKILLVIVVFYIVFYTLMLSSCSETNHSSSEADYETMINEVRGASDHMPDIEKLGAYQNISINRKTTRYLLWGIDTVSVSVYYSENDFTEEIKKISESYSFVNENSEHLHDISATIDTCTVKIVDKEEKPYSNYYPKCFMMIGTNYERRSITYMYHYDIDLDEIDNLDSFIEKYYLFN